MKKNIFLSAIFVLICVMIGSVGTVSANEGFYDVDNYAYYAESAYILNNAGIVSGYEDNTFRAENPVTRAEMVTFICRAMNMSEAIAVYNGQTTELTKDVSASHWASAYVCFSVIRDIVSGYGDGTFRPDNNVLYEEAVKMIVCAFGDEYDMIKDPNDWAKGYIDYADRYGITMGVVSSRGQYINRGDVVVMVHNAIRDKLHYLYINYDSSLVQPGYFENKSGYYLEGTVIPLDIQFVDGVSFMYWECNGDGYFINEYSPKTEFITGGMDTEIIAAINANNIYINNNVDNDYIEDNYIEDDYIENNYIEDDYDDYDDYEKFEGDGKKYNLTIKMLGCGGIRDTSGKYESGANVPIYVYTGTEEGFIKWSASAGTLIDPYDPTGMITMPTEDVVVYAWFTPDGKAPKGTEYYVDNGDGTFTYFEGSENADNYDESNNDDTDLNEYQKYREEFDELREAAMYDDYFDYYEMENEVFKLVNEEREKNGLRKLYKDGALALRNAALDHCVDMHVRDFFDHVNPDGSTPSDRINWYYDFDIVGENIAKGQTSAQEVMDDWMNSPGHRANILSEDFNYIGIAVVYYNGTYIWTQCFGA